MDDLATAWAEAKHFLLSNVLPSYMEARGVWQPQPVVCNLSTRKNGPHVTAALIIGKEIGPDLGDDWPERLAYRTLTDSTSHTPSSLTESVLRILQLACLAANWIACLSDLNSVGLGVGVATPFPYCGIPVLQHGRQCLFGRRDPLDADKGLLGVDCLTHLPLVLRSIWLGLRTSDLPRHSVDCPTADDRVSRAVLSIRLEFADHQGTTLFGFYIRAPLSYLW
ncbi:hypothetical protein CLAIMM_14970 [Cladophialophora immunda]|nr:hypothetical protein CLAIMM_14970 [Cladophialophora immunda]